MKLKRALALVLAAALCVTLFPAAQAAGGFPDVPAGHWAEAEIERAGELGLIEGLDDGSFGLGREISRAEFATLVCRVMGWELASPAAASFSDAAAGDWFYTYIETAVKNGAVPPGGSFRPLEAISREDMAVMLVRALGYETLSSQVESFGSPFSDLSGNAGYITIASDIGMINGDGTGRFLPKSTATREQAAAMLLRVYERLTSKTGWQHGFYAFSSYSQRELTASLDAVSFGWSRLVWDGSRASLNTGSEGGNEWRIPDEYNAITGYLDSNGTRAHLNVFTAEASGMLKSEQGRAQAVAAIIDEVTRDYELIGKSPYSGVTIDFESLYSSDKANFTAFLTELSAQLKARNLTLYVAVHAALPDGEFYGGYDYRAIGNLADKVILMTHDYAPADLEGFVGTQWHKNAAIAPIDKVYYALRAITDESSGVADRSKIALAISFSAMAWELDASGNLAEPLPEYPTSERIAQRAAQPDAELFYSENSRNAYMTYKTEDGSSVFLWYESAESVADRLALARLFGVTGVSYWRLGNIPDYIKL